jgi:outer membrane cobalamin receptor
MTVTTLRKSQRTLALIVALAAAGTAAAQTSGAELASASLEDLMNITITTASRTAEGAGDAPARVQVVTAAEVRRRGYRSLADLLKDLPDFKVDLAGDQDYPTELTVQGTRGASRVVLLLNGVRVSSPTNEPLPILANYPVHSARQIEILYGPASALYGADAFSAVINIISKDASEAPGLAVSTSVGQFGLYNQTGSYGARLGPNVSLMVAGQAFYDRQPDLSRYFPDDYQGLAGQRSGTFNTIFGPMTSNRPVSPEYSIPMSAHSVEATLRAGPLQLMVFENHSRVSTTPAYTPDNAVYNADAFNRNKLLVTSATYSRPIGRVTSTSTLTFSRHELDPESGYWNVYSNLKKSYKYAYGTMAKAEEQLSWKPRPATTVTTGGTFERFFAIPQGADVNAPVRSRNTPGTILDTNIPDEFNQLRYDNVGAFAQVQEAVTPALSLTLGARSDYNTRFGGTFNPRLGLVARPASGTTLKVLYGSAFLAPSPYQSYGHYGAFYSTDGGETYASSYWHLPNPDLKPQIKKTIEVNVLQALGSRVQLSGATFYSRFSNIVKESDADLSYAGYYHGWPVDYIDFPVNEGRATIYGGTLGATFLQPLGLDRRLQAHAALTLADGTVSDSDDEITSRLPVGGMSPLQARLGADFDWDGWSASPRLAIVGRQRVLATYLAGDSLRRRTLDGFLTMDATVRRREVVRHVDAFVTVENALDRRYRTINARAFNNPEEFSGAPQNPRRLTVGFDWRLK